MTLVIFTLPLPFLYNLNHIRTGTMQFLWCGIHLSFKERQHDPFESPALLPCATIECVLFREEPPLCVHLIREGCGNPAPYRPRIPHFSGVRGNNSGK